MARSSSEVPENVQLDHQHSYTYVFPVPASINYKAGFFPYMLCGCGHQAKIMPDEDWWVPAVEGVGPDDWATKP